MANDISNSQSSMNYMARYAHFEHPDLVIFSLSPGWVQTEMGNLGARTAGMEKAPITVDESVGKPSHFSRPCPIGLS